MSARIALLILVIGLFSSPLASASDSADERARIEAARASLKERLIDAESKGVVALKGQSDPAGAASARPREAAHERPALRAGEIRSIACLTPDMLSETAAAIAVDPVGAIDALKNAILDPQNKYRREIELQLAVSYLVIGFAEEAGATVREIDDPRATAIAALASLMSGAPAGADIGSLSSCGKLAALIGEAARAREGAAPQMGEAEIELLSSLPAPVAAPISEILALAALDHGDIDLARELDETIARMRKSGDASPAQSLIRITTGEKNATKEQAIAAISPIAAAPGPLQARAIAALSEALPVTDISTEAAGLALDLEDAAASASNPRDRAELNLILAERGAGSISIQAGVKALAKSAAADAAKSISASEAARRVLGDALRADDADRRLDALAAIVASDGFAARSLDEDAATRAISELTMLGAADAVRDILSARGAPARSARLAIGAAALRAGDYDDAWMALEPYAAQPEFANLVFDVSAARGDAAAMRQAKTAAEASGNQEVKARIAWRSGDFAAAETALSRTIGDAADKKTAERLALAALASGRKSAPAGLASVLSGADNGAALLLGFFQEPPQELGAAKAFAEEIAGEIAFIRGRIAHE